jgi:Holliday junction resolvase RusA-like endonuclease
VPENHPPQSLDGERSSKTEGLFEFVTCGIPRPYLRPLNDGRGGRRADPKADAWKRELRVAASWEVHRRCSADPELARRLGGALWSTDRPAPTRAVLRLARPWFEKGVAVRLEAIVLLVRPKSHFTRSGKLKDRAPAWHVQAPDASNFLKEIEDALGAWPKKRGTRPGGAPLLYHDDAQVVCSSCYKRWLEPGERQGALVRIWPVG